MHEPLEQGWEQYSRRLRVFIRGRVWDDAEADDILQEVFIRVHRHLCCQPNWDKPDSWFYQIARNLIIDHYRRRRELVELSDSLPADPDFPEANSEAELALSLKEMIDELPEPYRQALLLTEYQGLSQKQLAESQGLSLSGAKSRVQRAREKLRDRLLQCCHFEFDRRGGIVDYYEHCCCCSPCM
ncbi:ECF RNA polymerase sigma factor SigE [Gammaproteobacteria bacterium]|nr:ECF RNA polymerase sigma factor SigE [Gammaproteobacteria bacterium]